MYKLVAKILASKLRKVMGKIMSFNQTDFVLGRQILDGVLEINEIIDFAKIDKRD